MKKIILLSSLLFSVNAFAQHTVWIQPHFNGQESQIDDQTPDRAFSNAPEMDAMGWTVSGTPVRVRDLIRFADISNRSVIPAHSKILSAKLYLYGLPSSPQFNFGNSFYAGSSYTDSNQSVIYELADSFDYTTVTWNKQPNTVADSVIIPVSHEHWNENDTLDVTKMVADMYANKNTGFVIKMVQELPYTARMWGANNYATDSTLHPALQVTYYDTIKTAVNTIEPLVNDFNISPNPAQHTINLQISANQTAQANLTIYDVMGRVVHKESMTLQQGNNREYIDVSGFISGVYMIEVNDGENKIRKKVIKL